MTRQLIGFVAAVTCLGFFMFAMPAGATSQGCPQETPYYCDPGPCELGTCAVDESQCIYSPAPEGKPCTYGGVFLGGRCDGAGSCGPPCDDRDHDSSCDPMQPAMHSSTCEGDYVAQDPTSGLCWEKYMTNEPYSMYHDDAVDICANSDAGGYFDWRLPTIDELRSIIVGCPDRELGGACQVSDPTCLEWDQCSSECGTTTCPNPLPGQQRHTAPFLEDGGTQVWSSSPDPSNPGAYWGINYYYAIIQTYSSWAPHVRCVRDVHAGTGGPTQEVISDSTPGDSWNQHVFNVEPGSQFSVTFETHSGSAFYFVEWDQPGGFGGNQCYKHVPAGQTDSCDNLTVDAAATEAYVSVNGGQFGVDYTITVDYVAPGGTSCTDSDGDGVCDADDICPGFDDNLDTDGDGVADCQDPCPLDNPDDPDGNGECGEQECALETSTYTSSGNVGPYGQDIHTIEPVVSGTPFAISLMNPDGIEWNITHYFYDADGYVVFGTGSNYTGSPIVVPVFDVPAGAVTANVYLNSYDGTIAADYTLNVNYEAIDCSSCPDADGDGVCDADDICPDFDDTLDADGDGTPDGCDSCVNDPAKTIPGVCGCGVADDDSDGDGVADCMDICDGGDDNVDSMGRYFEPAGFGTGYAIENGVPDYCDCLKFDVTGNITTNPLVIDDNDAVTADIARPDWWQDDTMTCYNTLLTPAYLAYFPGCDTDDSGGVGIDDVLSVYYFALEFGGSVSCDDLSL